MYNERLLQECFLLCARLILTQHNHLPNQRLYSMTPRPIPNPGSPAALKKGCICPINDNNEGNGWTGTDNEEQMFWIMEGCPLHTDEWFEDV